MDGWVVANKSSGMATRTRPCAAPSICGGPCRVVSHLSELAPRSARLFWRKEQETGDSRALPSGRSPGNLSCVFIILFFIRRCSVPHSTALSGANGPFMVSPPPLRCFFLYERTCSKFDPPSPPPPPPPLPGGLFMGSPKTSTWCDAWGARTCSRPSCSSSAASAATRRRSRWAGGWGHRPSVFNIAAFPCLFFILCFRLPPDKVQVILCTHL